MLRFFICILLVIVAAAPVGARRDSAVTELRKFDDFGDLKCEDEMARLDNVAIQMQNEPKTKAVLIFFGGTKFRGKIPRENEAAARAARL